MNQPPLNPDARRGYISDGAGLNAACTAYVAPGFGIPAPTRMDIAIQAYLAAALPEVTEREQLTALPDKIVLEDRRGTIWQKINGTWYTPGSKHDYSDQSVMLPARVLYRPEVKP